MIKTIDALLEQYRQLLRRGNAPTIEEYSAQHRHCKEALKKELVEYMRISALLQGAELDLIDAEEAVSISENELQQAWQRFRSKVVSEQSSGRKVCEERKRTPDSYFPSSLALLPQIMVPLSQVYFPRVLKTLHDHSGLYNLDKARESAGDQGLILVEKFSHFVKLWQAGFRNVVVLMGASVSDRQLELLVKALGDGGKLTLVLGSGEAQTKTRKRMLEKLMGSLYVRLIDLDEDET